MNGRTEGLAGLSTEQRNPATTEIDRASSLEIVRLINAEDGKVAAAVSKVLDQVAALVDILVEQFRLGGRLFYVGAGTSGRLGTLDAVECPPTFGVSPEMVQSIMAGGEQAWKRAVEGAEDDREAGARSVHEAGVSPADVVVGIAASGRTPFVLGALAEARRMGSRTGAVTNHQGSDLGKLVDVAVEVSVGPEVLSGSTRMKAGTAQKMVLNMLTTASMIRLGKAYENLMVDMMATNAKLRDRAKRIFVEVTGSSEERADLMLQAAGGSARLAIAMEMLQCDAQTARTRLDQHGGVLRNALDAARGSS